MAYRDIEKRRETTKLRVRRYRALHKGVTSSVTPTVNPIDKLKAKYDIRQGSYKPTRYNPGAIPLYNASIHKPGDRVRMYQGNRLIELVIPELDADGNPIP